MSISAGAIWCWPRDHLLLVLLLGLALAAGLGGVDWGALRLQWTQPVWTTPAWSWAATLSQTLTVGANTRVEFKRDGEDGCLDVELPRAESQALRERLALQRGSRVFLKPRRVTRFSVGQASA